MGTNDLSNFLIMGTRQKQQQQKTTHTHTHTKQTQKKKQSLTINLKQGGPSLEICRVKGKKQIKKIKKVLKEG